MKTQERSDVTSVYNFRMTFIILFLLLVIVAGLLFFVYLKNQEVNFENINVKKIIEIISKKNKEQVINEITGNPDSEFCIYKNFLVECDGKTIKAMNKKGSTQWEFHAPFHNPTVKVCDSYMVAADIGGKELYFFDGNYIQWDKKLKQNIINIEISNNGYVIVVREAKGVKAAVTLYKKNGNEIFTSYFSNRYVVSAEISPQNSHVLINCIDTSGVMPFNCLEFVDIYGRSIAAGICDDGTVFPLVEFLDNNTVVIAGNNKLICYKSDGSQKWVHEFNGRIIYSTSIMQGNNIVVAASGTGKPGTLIRKNPELLLFDEKGRQTARCEIDSEVINITSYCDMAGVNTGREVLFINDKGKVTGKYTAKSVIKSIYFYNKLEAAVITKNGVTIVKTYT